MSECRCKNDSRTPRQAISTVEKEEEKINKNKLNFDAKTATKMSDPVEDFLAREKDGLAGLESEIPQAFQGAFH